MKADSHKQNGRQRRQWVPYFVLLAALLLTLLATYYVSATAEAKDRLRFENAVQITQDNIKNRLQTYIALLRSGTGLFTASDEVTRDEFQTYAVSLNLQANYPGVQGIGFSIRLKPEERDALIAKMKRQGIPDFHIWPEQPRPEYHTIIYLEPRDRRNLAAIGYDMFTDEVRRAAMEQARDTALPTASGRVTLVQEIDEQKQAGFLIYAPVYQGGKTPATVAERQAALMGFVYSPFRANDLLDGIFGTERNHNLDFQIYDGKEPAAENLLYNSGHVNPVNDLSYRPRYSTSTTLEVAGRTWNLNFATRPEFDATSGMNLVPFTLLGGALISLVLFGITHAQAQARAAAEHSAAELKQSEEALRQSESRLRRLVDSNFVGLIIGDFQGRILEANDAFLKIVGYTREDIQAGKVNWVKLTPPEYFHLDQQAMQEMKRTGTHPPFEKEYIRKDGTRVPVLVGTSYLGGAEELGVGFLLDITDRKRAEEVLRESEDRYERAAVAGKVGIWDLNLKTNELYLAPNLKEILGYTDEELPNQLDAWSRLVHPEDKERVMAATREHLTGKSPRYEVEVRRRHKDGHYLWFVAQGIAIKDAEGQPFKLVGSDTDITERKLAQQALDEANQRAIVEYKRLLERISTLAQALGTARDLLTVFRALRDFAVVSVPSIGIFISLYDPQKQVRTAAYAWGDGLEFDVTSLPPMPITTDGPNSIAVKTGEMVITDDYMTATKGHPNTVVGPDNGLRPQSSLAAPMAVMGRIVGTIEVQSYERAAYKEEHATAMRMAANLAAIAIENVRLLEHESQARAIAEESNRMKDEFLATVSHELRTPLTSILGWAQMLRSGAIDERTAALALETIERNAKVQSQIIEDILDVSRIITGKLNLEVRPVELVSVIESAINAVRPAANAKAIQLETGINRQPHFVSGDANRLQQIVWNLLSNAVKFTPRGGRVQVSLRRVPGNVEIIVSDSGQGISKEFLPFVFERFRQADSTTTRQHGGLGLGLAIVRHLVELHGGTVHAYSDGPGQGSTFTVRLPLSGALTGEAEVKRLHSIVQSSGPAERNNRRHVHVLVVDDDKDTLAMLKAILEQGQMKVTAVTSASAALKAIEEVEPDVLVSDIGMPDEDGYELITRIRSLESNRSSKIPAVALTAYAREDDRQRSLAAGYQKHLSKPIEPSELLSVVAQLAGLDGERDGKASNRAGALEENPD